MKKEAVGQAEPSGANRVRMLVIVGVIVVFGAVLAGFSMAGGSVHALNQPSEFVTILGAALGAFIMAGSKKTLIDTFKGVISTIKGSPFSRAMYTELFKLGYDLLRVARRDGMLALDRHVNNPHESDIFNKYPKLPKNHHVVTFI